MKPTASPLLELLDRNLAIQHTNQPKRGAWDYVKKQTTPSPETSDFPDIQKSDSADRGGP
jgi:hypothetical protein